MLNTLLIEKKDDNISKNKHRAHPPSTNPYFKGIACAIILTASSTLLTFSDANAKPDFNGLWVMARYNDVIRQEKNLDNYTEEALQRTQRYEEHFANKGKEPSLFCYHPGMPWLMLTYARNYPYEIYQTDERIMVTFEPMELARTIHFDVSTFPENFPLHRMGYSIAHWEKDTLVIETRGLVSTNEIAAPVHRTEEARIIERWHFIDDKKFGQVIEITTEHDDPLLYKIPAKGRQLLKRAPEGTVLGGYNCPEARWDDFVEEEFMGK